MTHATDSSAYLSFAAELARQPELFRRLLVEHVGDSDGHCLACTAPGSQKQTAWPCALWKIAERASTIRTTWSGRQLTLVKSDASTPPDGGVEAPEGLLDPPGPPKQEARGSHLETSPSSPERTFQ